MKETRNATLARITKILRIKEREFMLYHLNFKVLGKVPQFKNIIIKLKCLH